MLFFENTEISAGFISLIFLKGPIPHVCAGPIPNNSDIVCLSITGFTNGCFNTFSTSVANIIVLFVTV